MQLCSQGHPIPAWAKGRCYLCTPAQRNSWQRGKINRFDSKRRESNRGDLEDSFPSAPTELPADKKMPDFSRLSKPVNRRASSADNTWSSGSIIGTVLPPSFVVVGVNQFLATVCDKSTTIETILSNNNVSPQKIMKFLHAVHPFVSVMLIKWHILFGEILSPEEANVVKYQFGLECLPLPKNLHEIARRYKLSVQQVESRSNSAIQKLKYPTNRDRLISLAIEVSAKYSK